MLKIILYYNIGCLGLLVVNLTLQMIGRKNLMKNWAYVNDMTGEEREDCLKSYPPIDGVFQTIMFCFVPFVNLLYFWFLTMLSFKKTDSDLIQSFQFVARELEREKKWK